MTIGQHISAIRGLINNYSEKEVPFGKEQLYHLFRVEANYLTRQKYDKYNMRNQWHMKPYCVATEISSLYDCDCLPALCKTVRTKVRIPKPLYGRKGPFLRVKTLDYEDIGMINVNEIDSVKYDPVKSRALSYAIVDQYIAIYGPGTDKGIPKAIIVESIPEDPTSWDGIQACDTEGNSTGSACYNIESDEYPLDDDLVSAAYNMVLKKIGITLSIPNDEINELAQR